MTIKILNLYAGIGGNRKLWDGDIEVTAVEINEEIAGVYKSFFPKDKIVIGDAHQYLLDHYKEFDFIWASPPCPTHSKMCFSQNQKVYPSMQMYQEIIFLKSWFKGKWIVENVMPYYEPLVKPNVEFARHYFWCNFHIHKKEFPQIDISRSTPEELLKFHGIEKPNLKHYRTIVRNMVNPPIGLHIFNCMLKEVKQKQQTLDSQPQAKENQNE